MGEITLQRFISAPPSTVYRFLTESDKWELWQGIGADLDPQPGGGFGMDMGNGMKARGQFVELVPDSKVVFTWGWVGHPAIPPGSTTVEITLETEGAGTRLTLTHLSIPDDEVAMQQMGWTHYLPRLADIAAGRDPGIDQGPG